MTAPRSKSHLVGQSWAVDPRRRVGGELRGPLAEHPGPHTAPRLLVQRVIVTGHAFGVAAQRSAPRVRSSAAASGIMLSPSGRARETDRLLHTRPAPRPVQDRHESRSAAPLWVERSAVWYAASCSEVMTGTYCTVAACRSPLGSASASFRVSPGTPPSSS